MFKQFNKLTYYLYLLLLVVISTGLLLIDHDTSVVSPILSFAVALLGLSNVFFTYQGLKVSPVNRHIAQKVGINTGISTILLFVIILFFAKTDSSFLFINNFISIIQLVLKVSSVAIAITILINALAGEANKKYTLGTSLVVNLLIYVINFLDHDNMHIYNILDFYNGTTLNGGHIFNDAEWFKTFTVMLIAMAIGQVGYVVRNRFKPKSIMFLSCWVLLSIIGYMGYNGSYTSYQPNGLVKAQLVKSYDITMYDNKIDTTVHLNKPSDGVLSFNFYSGLQINSLKALNQNGKYDKVDYQVKNDYLTVKLPQGQKYTALKLNYYGEFNINGDVAYLNKKYVNLDSAEIAWYPETQFVDVVSFTNKTGDRLYTNSTGPKYEMIANGKTVKSKLAKFNVFKDPVALKNIQEATVVHNK
ncbi:hypothetical protein [Apilactobacillus xinyiensis]|uniref:Uncharacterized protein n=1 Tax=Apilactobacillus xinyiensis TaxID=2841032 RepID=A0ABT0I297_9LACO|nr:hypothetical protein [Apilactobacillus xinyiensis]MCK8624832.1 hypothetical protein [Apilactobacillus xinyiensis]MCL0319216.1 hypothetical protein [Apilactobacillus xinyiensis]